MTSNRMIASALLTAAAGCFLIGLASSASAVPPGTGVVVGTVTGKATTYVLGKTNCYIEVKDDKGKVERYVIHWTMEGYPPPGGYDKEMLAAVGLRNIGDRVEVHYTSDEAHRVHTMRVLAISAQAASQPGFDGGTAVGKVMEKGKNFVVIKPDDAEPARYMPQRIVGEKDSLDKEVLRAMSAAAIGNRVEAKWFGDGERRIYSLRPAAATVRPMRAPSVAAPPASQPADVSPLLDKIRNAPANTWIEVPDSALLKVAPKPEQFPKTWAVMGPWSVVGAWCGAALDTKRDRLVVWGGGHADYHGNELYVFDIKKLAWERLNDPFPNPVNDQEVNADGTPNSRHTYGGLAYLTHADRFFGLGGSIAGNGGSDCNRTWVFDFDAKKWQDRQPTGQLPGGGLSMGCAYDPVSKRLFFGSEHRGLFAYDYDKNAWTRLDDQPVDGQGFAVDTKRKLLVGVGRGRITFYDIGQNNFKQQTINAPAAGAVVNANNAAGFDYDPVADRMVGWAASLPDKVFGLDLDAKTWETKQADGGPKKSQYAGNGVFGRWRYVPSVNAFIVVSDAGGNVFFYKYSAGLPAKAGQAPKAK